MARFSGSLAQDGKSSMDKDILAKEDRRDADGLFNVSEHGSHAVEGTGLKDESLCAATDGICGPFGASSFMGSDSDDKAMCVGSTVGTGSANVEVVLFVNTLDEVPSCCEIGSYEISSSSSCGVCPNPVKGARPSCWYPDRTKFVISSGSMILAVIGVSTGVNAF